MFLNSLIFRLRRFVFKMFLIARVYAYKSQVTNRNRSFVMRELFEEFEECYLSSLSNETVPFKTKLFFPGHLTDIIWMKCFRTLLFQIWLVHMYIVQYVSRWTIDFLNALGKSSYYSRSHVVDPCSYSRLDTTVCAPYVAQNPFPCPPSGRPTVVRSRPLARLNQRLFKLLGTDGRHRAHGLL